MALRTSEASEQDENRIDENYARGDGIYKRGKDRLDAVALRDRENREAANGTGPDEKKSVSNQEEQGIVNKFTGSKNSSRGGSWKSQVKGTITGKKKGPATAIITLVLLGLGLGGGFFGASLAPIAWLANTTLDLNDPLSALEERGSIFKAAKIRPGNATSFGCKKLGSALSMKCKYVTMSEKMVNRYKDAGIEITGETKFGNRIKPTEFMLNGQRYPAAEFMDEVRNNPNGDLAKAYNSANRMKFLSMSGPNFVNKTLGKWNLSKRSPQLQGDIDERLDTLSNRTDGGTISSNLHYVDAVDPVTNEPLVDDDGNQYKRLAGDPDGKLLTQADIDGAKAAAVERIKTFDKPLARGALGVSLLGWYDTGCSIVKSVGAAALGVKVANAAQLAEYAMPVAALSDELKAGYITNENAQVIQRFMNDTDARETITGIIESEGEENAVGEVPNPDFGKSAMDSELYKMSANGGVAATSVVDTRYSLGFGVNSLARKAEAFSSSANSVVNLDNLDTCDYVQSWWGRAGGVIAGVIVGGFTFGTSVGVSTAANAALVVLSFFIDDILNAVLSENLINDSMDEAPVEKGSAAWTGMAAIHSQHAMSRGMMPGNSEQIVAYQAEQNEVRQKYIALERQKSNPLDINNPYSITGSVALAMHEHLPSGFSASALASLPKNISSFVFGGLASALKPSSVQAARLNPERFKQCDDPSYEDIGIDADVQCNVRYVMPDSSMQHDPLEVAQWMEDEGYVEKDTTTGLPEGYTPPDESENHNIAMAFVMGQIDTIYNTRQYGDDDYKKFLDFCVYRTLPFGEAYDENGSFGDASPEWKSGKNCMMTEATADNAEFGKMIDYFRMYVFDMSVNDDLDEAPIISSINCGPFGGSSGGSVGGKISETEFNQLITEYGLPEPKADLSPDLIQYGSPVKGYEELLEHLKSEPKAAWAAQAMLNGEKKWKSAGGEVKEYLNTTWLWFETGQNGWPDPYQMNCHNLSASTYATKVCPTNDFQTAGYQGENRKNDYVEVFNKLYSEDELVPVMEAVVKNSSNAVLDIWNYSDPSNDANSHIFSDLSGVTLNDISPNKDFFDERTQILTLILGKDPNMAAALNSFAVSDDDILAHLGTGEGCGPGWGHYICKPARQQMANMMKALYMFDGQGPASGANCLGEAGRRAGSGVGIAAVWGGGPEITIEDIVYGYKAVPDKDSGADPTWYDYGAKHGLSGLVHTGTDIPMAAYAPVYSPVEGIVICERNGVGEGIKEAGCAGAGDLSGEGVEGYDGTKPSGAGTIMIEITENGNPTGDYLRLGHLSDSLVKLGETVKPNQHVGSVGYMNGWHVHVEYFTPVPPGEAPTPSGFLLVDPVIYLDGGTNA